MQLMIGDRLPVEDPKAMIAWFDDLLPVNQGRVAPPFRKRLEEERAKLPKEEVGSAPAEPSEVKGRGFLSEAETAEFERSYDSSRSAQDALKDMRKQRAYWLYVLNSATRRGEARGIEFAGKQFVRYSSDLHKAELRALKQGLETGDVMTKLEVERIVAAWAFHSMQAVDAALPSLCRKLVGVSSPHAARKILEPVLLGAKYLEPFRHAVGLATGSSLPAWFSEKMVDSVDDFIENGRKLIEGIS